MGSQGRRRGRRTRSDRPGGRSDLEDGFPAFQHNQWTFEGEIERLGALARGVNRSSGSRRHVGRVFFVILLAPFLFAIVAYVIALIV
jgi:hypothetical protein